MGDDQRLPRTMKSLGFVQRHLSAGVAWQAIVGNPLGIIVGHQLWILFAREIDAVPDPTFPVVSVLAVAVGALVFAYLAFCSAGAQGSESPDSPGLARRVMSCPSASSILPRRLIDPPKKPLG